MTGTEEQRRVAGGDQATRPEPSPGRGRARRRRRVGGDLAALAVVGVLLIAALTTTGSWVYQKLYSPTAFVEDYLELLTYGRAADALAVPGVAVSSAELEKTGLPVTSSDALLRRAAMAPLSNVQTVSEETRDGISYVTVSYTAGSHNGTTTFAVEQQGWFGIAPTWRFAETPLSVINLTVTGASAFTVNGFSLDKRQLGGLGNDVDQSAPVPLLVFTPGLYSVSVSTAVSESAGVAVLADAPHTTVPVPIQTQPTAKFTEVVQTRVNDFLAQCAGQTVLQPTGCPFGFVVQNRLAGDPAWSITSNPTVTLEPDGEAWRIRDASGTARLSVDIRSIFDGSVRHLEEDVPFTVSGTVTILPDDSAAIEISSGDEEQ